MAATLRARSTPYRPDLRSTEKVCTRCGIIFRTDPRCKQHAECRDCR